jgi:hypothetical protein
MIWYVPCFYADSAWGDITGTIRLVCFDGDWISILFITGVMSVFVIFSTFLTSFSVIKVTFSVNNCNIRD